MSKRIIEEKIKTVPELMTEYNKHQADIEQPTEVEMVSIILTLPLDESLSQPERLFIWNIGFSFISSWINKRDGNPKIDDLLTRVASKIEPFNPQR